MKAKPEFI